MQEESCSCSILHPGRAVPVGEADGALQSQTRPAPQRVVHTDDAFESVWSDWFTDETAAIEWWKSREGNYRPKKCKEVDGFKVCSSTGPPRKHRVDEIDRFRSGKKTSNMPMTKVKDVGDCCVRRYVAYANEHDPSTARFCLHWIKKIA